LVSDISPRAVAHEMSDSINATLYTNRGGGGTVDWTCLPGDCWEVVCHLHVRVSFVDV